MQEWELPSDDDVSGKQMAKLCRKYMIEQAGNISVPGLLAYFAIEGIHVIVAAHIFRKMGYAARHFDSAIGKFIVVSTEKVPSDLKTEQQQLRELLVELEAKGENVQQEEMDRLRLELEEVDKELESLPAHSFLWANFPVALLEDYENLSYR